MKVMLRKYNMFSTNPSAVQYSFISEMKKVLKLHQILFIFPVISHYHPTVINKR